MTRQSKWTELLSIIESLEERPRLSNGPVRIFGTQNNHTDLWTNISWVALVTHFECKVKFEAVVVSRQLLSAKVVRFWVIFNSGLLPLKKHYTSTTYFDVYKWRFLVPFGTHISFWHSVLRKTQNDSYKLESFHPITYRVSYRL